MPAKYKKIIDPPITRSDYTRMIKDCCIHLPDNKEYVGKCIAAFRDEAVLRDEKRNFKFCVKSDTGRKLFKCKVTGGFRGLTCTKYYVNHQGIYRYDWRAQVWQFIKRFTVQILKEAAKFAIKEGIRNIPMIGPAFNAVSEYFPGLRYENPLNCLDYLPDVKISGSRRYKSIDNKYSSRKNYLY